MIPLENACQLLGDSLGPRWGEVANRRNGTGFSIWYDFEDTVHVDFVGFPDFKEVDELRNLAVGLHESLEIDEQLQVDFFANHEEAQAAMIRHFDDGDEP